MSHKVERIREIVIRDLDPEFIRSFSISIGWAYDQLYEDLKGDITLDDTFRSEEFAKRRSGAVVRALTQAAQIHGVPYQFHKLGCNGQEKLLVKAGRLVLIQEPMLALNDRPRVAQYKLELAESHSEISQLELDLGDQPHRIINWSGCFLSVILHGASGKKFTREEMALGGLMLAVPDSSYRQWLVRLDLHRIAMFGSDKDAKPVVQKELVSEKTMQRDDVRVELRRRKWARDAG